MELKDKLEILIKRNGYKKTDFASAVSITYRALANYISGARTPRAKTLSDMAVLLGVSEEMLTDDTVDLILSSDEKLYFYGTSPAETRQTRYCPRSVRSLPIRILRKMIKRHSFPV